MGNTPGITWEGHKCVSNLVRESFAAGNRVDVCGGADGQRSFAVPALWESAPGVSAAAELVDPPGPGSDLLHDHLRRH